MSSEHARGVRPDVSRPGPEKGLLRPGLLLRRVVRDASRLPRPVLLVLALLPVGLIAFAREAASVRLDSWPLMLLPVLAVSWVLGLRYGLAMSAAAVGSTWAAARWVGAFPPEPATALFQFALLAGLAGGVSRLRQRLEDVSRNEPLTGFPNERAFLESLRCEMLRRRRYGRPFGVIYADLDDFGAFCKLQGEYAAERVVLCLAAASRSLMRQSDLLAIPRRGGDEILLLLPETDAAGLDAAMERFHRALRDALRASGWPLGVSVCGLVPAGCDGTPEQILENLELSMRRRKSAGRTRGGAGALRGANIERA